MRFTAHKESAPLLGALSLWAVKERSTPPCSIGAFNGLGKSN
jgi:hypothetical protein